jgi:hypothetical protein
METQKALCSLESLRDKCLKCLAQNSGYFDILVDEIPIKLITPKLMPEYSLMMGKENY